MFQAPPREHSLKLISDTNLDASTMLQIHEYKHELEISVGVALSCHDSAQCLASQAYASFDAVPRKAEA